MPRLARRLRTGTGWQAATRPGRRLWWRASERIVPTPGAPAVQPGQCALNEVSAMLAPQNGTAGQDRRDLAAPHPPQHGAGQREHRDPLALNPPSITSVRATPVGQRVAADVAERMLRIAVDRPVEVTQLYKDEQPDLEPVDIGWLQPSSNPPTRISISRKRPIVSAEPDITLLASSSNCNRNMPATYKACRPQ